jgi:hypothetical protein
MDMEVVNFLVEKGADILVGSNGALRQASKNGQFEVANFLVEEWRDIKS